MQRSPLYTLIFATLVCIACAIVVSSAAVSLKEKQEVNAQLERKRNVLLAAGLMEPGEELAAEEVRQRFATVDAVAVDLRTGEPSDAVDPLAYDMQRAAKDPESSSRAPKNPAQIQRVPHYAVVYQVKDTEGDLRLVVLPVEGKGLWSTMYGFLALENDLDTVRGITFYQHGETPGLGGEVDNQKWKDKWVGRQVYGVEVDEPVIEVIKGQAGPPAEDPFRVDGLSGATITSRGVTHMIEFWLGERGFAPYLKTLGAERSA